MSDTARNTITETIAKLLSERQIIAMQVVTIDARIAGLREALDAFEATPVSTTAPKAKRAYKRRAPAAAASNGPVGHATELKSAE